MPEQPSQGAAPQQLKIKIDEPVANGHYANLVIINHSPAEFVLDFVRVVPNTPQAKVQTRVLLSPIHAKALMKALETNVKSFEEKHGEIKVSPKQDSNKHFGFQG